MWECIQDRTAQDLNGVCPRICILTGDRGNEYVSGSVNRYLPKIVSLLRCLENELKSIFLFSTEVVEVPFKTLLAGRVQTTYGTDFDCIAEHITGRRFDKAVILTDGFASMNDENQTRLKADGVCTLTVLFGGNDVCPDLAGTGSVVELEDVIQ